MLALSLSLFPVASTLEHRASVKRFVSLQFLNPKTVGRTPWTGDQPIAKPLSIQTDKIYALSGIRTHNPSIRAGEDNSCLKQRGHRDRHNMAELNELKSGKEKMLTDVSRKFNYVFILSCGKWHNKLKNYEDTPVGIR
jgi:hypothetical protein